MFFCLSVLCYNRGCEVVSAAALGLAAKGWKIPLLPLLDGMVILGRVAFCLARVGCFLNGCCAGKVTDGPFGVLFPEHGLDGQSLPGLLSFLQNRPVHPTQLYELAGAAIGLLAVLLICRMIHADPGSRFMLYAAVFSAVRLLVLPLRALSYPVFIKNIVYPILYLAIIGIGTAWTVKKNRRAGAKGQQRVASGSEKINE